MASLQLLRPRRGRGHMIDASMRRLQELQINLLAIDFDMTLIDIHTGGRWDGTSQELQPHVRPELEQLVLACCEHDIQVAVVTFTPQVALVRDILDSIVGAEQSARIPIRGGDHSWTYNGDGSVDRKQPHIASAVEELETNNPNVRITKSTTLLIDDDPKNVKCALQDGVRAIWLNPDKPHQLLQDLVKLK